MAFVVGVTLLQPRKKEPVVVSTLNRGEPPWHWVALANVNDADWNVWPLTFYDFNPYPADDAMILRRGGSGG